MRPKIQYPQFREQVDPNLLTSHSEQFTYNIDLEMPHPKFKQNLIDALAEDDLRYDELHYLLLEYIDSHFGIISRLIEDPNFPNHFIYCRNTQNVLMHQVPPDKLITIHIANMLLRTLSTLRAINHVTQDKFAIFLKQKYIGLLTAVYALQDVYSKENLAKIRKHNGNFNYFLIHVLQESLVCAQNEKMPYYTKLLDYCRFLGGTLDPAYPILTLMAYANNEIVQIAYPITHKLESQKSALRVIVEPSLSKNFFNKQDPAFQRITAAFYFQLIDDNRLLSAQLRNKIAPLVKNGFFVKVEIYDENANLNHEFSLLRSATIVYMGKGEKKEKIKIYAEQNVQQLQAAALHYGGQSNPLLAYILVTDTIIRNQRKMVAGVRRAMTHTKNLAVYMPLNDEGCWHVPTIPKEMNAPWWTHLPTPLCKEFRCEQTATLAINNIFLGLIFISCASGQDRTGVIFALIMIYFLMKKLHLTFEHAATVYVLSMLEPVMSSYACAGSLGLKKASRPGKLFPEALDEKLFTDIAKTNKKSPIKKTELMLDNENYGKSIRDRLEGYLNSSAGILGGLSLFQNYWLRVKKRELVFAFLEQFNQGDYEHSYSDFIKNLEESSDKLINSTWFFYPGRGRLGHIIDNIKAELRIR